MHSWRTKGNLSCLSCSPLHILILKQDKHKEYEEYCLSCSQPITTSIFNKQQITTSTFNKQQITTSTFNKQQITTSTFNKQQITTSTFNKQNPFMVMYWQLFIFFVSYAICCPFRSKVISTEESGLNIAA